MKHLIQPKWWQALMVGIFLGGSYFIFVTLQDSSSSENTIYQNATTLEKKRVNVLNSKQSQKSSFKKKQPNNLPLQNKTQALESFEEFIKNHPYNHRKYTPKEWNAISKPDRPDLAAEQNYLMTIDPRLRRVPSERLIEARKRTFSSLARNKNKRAIQNVRWEERGPNNVGGRTRALMFDPNDLTHKKVWAAGVSGGVWYNNDITDANSSWQKVNDFWSNLAVCALAYDPNNPQVFYAGTGEGYFNSNSVKGVGIWKSSDGGQTWSQLSNTTDFKYVIDIVVTATGTILASTRENGLQRSTDGGATWTQVLVGAANDLELASDGTLYITFGLFANFTGAGIYKSTNDGASWSNISPPKTALTGLPVRTEIAVAPSNPQVLYVVAVGNHLQLGNKDVVGMAKSTDGGNTWQTGLPIPPYLEQSCVIESNHFTRSLGWLALILQVHPNDENTLIAGGIDLHKSTDGGQTWTPISYWRRNLCKPYVHADQHTIVFRPNHPNEAIFGNDGGVFYSTDVGNSASPGFETRNKNYNVTQFYAVAIKNIEGSNYMLAGAQDNQTQQFENNGNSSTNQILEGDGGYCFIDHNQPNIQLGSSQFGYYFRSINNGERFESIGRIGSSSLFITPGAYDQQSKILYSSGAGNQLKRIEHITTNPSDIKTVNIDIGTGKISHIRANTHTPNRLFIGPQYGTDRVYRVDNAHTDMPTLTGIGNGIGVNGYISCIDVGSSDEELIVTYSNYGVQSVWYTNNGGQTWVSKDEIGYGLPDMPIRWALFNPKNTKQVLLATEMGVWSTDDITATNPEWEATNTQLANIRCDMLRYRSADGLVAVATHGRGVFTTNVFVAPPDANTPTITSFTPERGASNNTIVTIKGTNFSPILDENIVRFNDQRAKLISATTTEIKTTIPPKAITGKISIKVKNKIGMSTTDFVVTPHIVSFSPVIGQANTIVTIIGSGLGGIVKFNGVEAKIYETNPNQLVVAVPANANTGEISVEVNGTTSVSTTNFTIGGYCASYPLGDDNTWSQGFKSSRIDQVQFAGIYQTGGYGCTNYTDYTQLSTQVARSQIVPFSITLGSCEGNFAKVVKIFVDWNNDQDFDDANELLSTSPVMGNGVFRDTITVPDIASDGIKRMRVVCNITTDTSKVQSCGIYAFGETEDYTLTVKGDTPTATITDFSPKNGQDSTLVTIQGKGFDLLTTVKFNGVPATTIYETSYNKIVALVPTNATTGKITVETKQASALSADDFRVEEGYCVSYPLGYDQDDWEDGLLDSRIDEVAVGRIHNITNSTCSNYSDHTDLVTEVTRSQILPIRITLGSCDSNYDKAVKVFVDWNNDKDFEDSGELIGTSSVMKNGVFTDSIIVPADAPFGRVRMRLVCQETDDSSKITACGIYQYGETEDYTIIVKDTNNTPTGIVDDLLYQNTQLFPNPGNGRFTIKIQGNTTKETTITVYDIRGAQIYAIRQRRSKFDINLIQYPKGVYLIQIVQGEATTMKRYIKL